MLLANLQGTTFLRCPSTNSKVLSLLRFSPWPQFLQENSCMHSLWQTFNNVEVLKSLNSAHTYSSSLSNASLRFATLRLLPSLRTPCTAPVPNCTSGWMRTKTISIWTLCQCTPCGHFNCTPCRNSLAQIEKQLKLIPSPFQTSNSNMKSHTQHIKENV